MHVTLRSTINRFLPAAAAHVLLAGLALAQVSVHPQLLLPVDPVPASALAWDANERAASPMITASRFVRLDTTLLRQIAVLGAPPLATLQLDLFETSVLIDVNRVQWMLGYRVFTGTVQNHDGEFHLSLAADGTTSGLVHFGGESFVISHAASADIHVLQRFDQAKLPRHMECGVDATMAVASPPGLGLPESPNSDCGKTTIDLLVVYTTLARQNAGSVSAMEAAIVGAVAQANTGHTESGVGVEFRLVHMAETSYAELGTSTDLSRFRNTSDGHMDEVHALRTTYGGDLMHLITNPASASYCGIGYLMTNLSTSFSTSAFAITVRTCIPGHTFTHESGHNMGCHHDFPNAGPALYPYSYGFRTADNAYRTIMAYAPGTRVNRWSSPNVLYQGYTMGAANTEDNALSVVNASTTVSLFHATVAPLWCDLPGGIPGALGLPTMTGQGTINLVRPLTLTIRNYQPHAPGILVIGTSAVNVPIFGGLLVPSLDVTLFVTGTGADIVHNANWLANLTPGFQAWFQVAFIDASAVQGLAASNGVKVTVP